MAPNCLTISLARRWPNLTQTAICIGPALFAPGDVAFASETAASLKRQLDLVIFGSIDGGATSGFVSAGFKKALTAKLDEPGLLIMGTTGSGQYRYRSENVEGRLVTDRPTQAGLLAGAQWFMGPETLVAIFFGPEYENQTLSPNDPGNKALRSRFGLKGQIEVYARPTDRTLVTATLVAGTAAPSVRGRLSAGFRVFEDVFIGPEITAYMNATYDEARLGLHATGIAIGRFTLQASGGLKRDGDGRLGAYGALGGYVTF